MSLGSIRWLSVVCLLATSGCVKADNVANDDGASSEQRDAGGITSRDAGGDAGSSPGRDDGGSPATNDDAGDDRDPVSEDDGGTGPSDDDGGTGSSEDDGGTGSSDDAGPGPGPEDPPPPPPVVDIAGSASRNHCLSTSPAENGMCSSHFCGVTEEQLAAAISADSVCGDAATTCEEGGRLAKKVTDCSIEVKATNLGKSNEQLRPVVQACVYKDAEFKARVNEECLGCFLDVAECAGDKCLVQCLTGSPAVCDKCRIDQGCEKPLFKCAGLPDPL